MNYLLPDVEELNCGVSLQSTRFFTDEKLCYADILTPSEARARIEIAVLNFLKLLTASDQPAISDLPLVSRKSSNSNTSRNLLTNMTSIFLSRSITWRSFTNANSCKAFARVWKAMEMCGRILSQNKRVTQREFFYLLLCESPDIFPTQAQVNTTIQDLVALLRSSRYSLGITASSRGIIAGRLNLQDRNGEILYTSRNGESGYAIPGDFALLDELAIQTDAFYIVVIEKHAIFQRLTEDGFFNKIPCILITGKGYPDLATRFLLKRMSTEFPHVRIFILVDWNPGGVSILSTYKYGSITMGLESFRYACDVKWLGLRSSDIEEIPEESLVPLTPKDIQIARSLLKSKFLPESYTKEIQIMLQREKRAEIEALYYRGYNYLGKFLSKKIVQGDYL